MAISAQQTETQQPALLSISIMGYELVGAEYLSFVSRVIYSMRFELVFVASFALLWLAGLFRKKGATDAPAKTKKASGYAGRRNASPSSGAQAHPKQRGIRTSTPTPTPTLDNNDVSDRPRGEQSVDAKDIIALAQGQTSSAQLRDAVWLIVEGRLVQLCQGQPQRAVEVYYEALDAGLDLASVSAADLDRLLMALVTSMIRMGQTKEVMRLLRDLQKRGVSVGQSVCISCVKLCTGKHCFEESLSIYGLLSRSGGFQVADKTAWSCLLFCAIECKAYQRCATFFEKLKACGEPSQKDYWNMIRFGAVGSDWRMMLQLIQEMRERGLEVDNVIYNTCLATCVSAGEIGEARTLLEEMGKVGNVTDVITYNTLMKGYAKSAMMDDCFQLHELMIERGVTPSQVTFGILLDGCICNNQVDRAANVFEMMTEKRCPMNTVLYTTLIKGFAREGKVDEAMRIYGQMSNDKMVQPDVITFSVLLKVNCDAGRLETALELLDSMLQSGLRPDEVIFNNLLAGCCEHGNATLAKRLYGDMVASGIAPSNATFSILIRLYSQCKLLHEAFEMLQTEPAKHKIAIEPRLYSQLIQSCIRARQGRRAVEVYELMLETAKAGDAIHNSMLGMCVKLNMFDTGAELMAVAAAKGDIVDQRDANLILEGAQRKKKASVVNSILASMQMLGLSTATDRR